MNRQVHGPQTAALRFIQQEYRDACFTPDMLLIYMQSRLNTLNEATKAEKEKQQKLNAASEVFSSLMQKLAEIQPGQLSPEKAAAIDREIAEAMKKIKDIDPALASKVEGMRDIFGSMVTRKVHFQDGSWMLLPAGGNLSVEDAIRCHAAAVNKARADRGLPHEPYDLADVERFNSHDNDELDGNDLVGAAVDRERGAGGASVFPMDTKSYASIEYVPTEIKAQDLERLTQQIKTRQNDLKNEADLGMTDLNTLMGQREHCVQLIQQMMQAQSEQARLANGDHG